MAGELAMLLMIDNYDSFTYDVVEYLQELGEEVQVHRNDEITVAAIREPMPDTIVILPGPGTPDETGISMAVIEEFAGGIPILAFAWDIRVLVGFMVAGLLRQRRSCMVKPH